MNQACAALYALLFLFFALGLLIGASIWAPWPPTEPEAKTVPEIANPCQARSQPNHGLYRLYNFLDRVAPLEIQTTIGSNYFVKLESAITALPIMTFFVVGGLALDTKVPLGTFNLMYAAGKTWCGERNL